MTRHLSRRDFIKASAALVLVTRHAPLYSNTVAGRMPASAIGATLVHEHFLVDFIGADQIHAGRWDKDAVVAKVLPYLLEVKKHGIKTIMDCTPAFLGRDVALLQKLWESSGVQIVTNTGYYGAVSNKYLPSWAFRESSEQLAQRWIDEFERGIDGTGVKPGFMKISVDPQPLSPLHQKLVTAAALTHLKTGLTICSHTGPAIPAFEQLELLQKTDVHPSAFVWTHAQAEADTSLHLKAASMGAWISLDGIGSGDFEKYADSIEALRAAGLLHKVLISHDAGWYKPGEPDGGTFTGYTNIFTQLIPILKGRGFTDKHIRQLLVRNPEEAFAIRVRRV